MLVHSGQASIATRLGPYGFRAHSLRWHAIHPRGPKASGQVPQSEGGVHSGGS